MGGRSDGKTPGRKSGDKELSAKKSAKRSPKAEASARKKKSEDIGGGSSSKTEQVMKLVQPHGDVVNPVIIAGKSSIPRHLRGVEPLSRIMRREAQQVLGEDIVRLTEPDEQVTVNVTELVIASAAADILRRFNACDCERCVSELSRRVSEKVQARYVRLSKKSLEEGSQDLDDQKESVKKAVLSQMVRELLGNKRRSFHD